MANQKYLKILKQGTDVWNEWKRKNNHIYNHDLTEADLTGANLEGADLIQVNLSGANLSGANLSDADIRASDLVRTNLSGANLSGANLNGASLYEANFEGADLSGANLNQVDSLGVNLKGANLTQTDLSEAVNFSRIDLTGVDLTGAYLKLCPIFLSYSPDDLEFADRLYYALINKGVPVWYDSEKMKPGGYKLFGVCNDFDVYEKMILVCSIDSLNSWWIDDELDIIFEKESHYRKVKGKNVDLLIPIKIDEELDHWKGANAERIKDKVVGDFTEWRNEIKFEKSLNQLIEAINVDRGNEDIIYIYRLWQIRNI